MKAGLVVCGQSLHVRSILNFVIPRLYNDLLKNTLLTFLQVQKGKQNMHNNMHAHTRTFVKITNKPGTRLV